mgnify:FL=1
MARKRACRVRRETRSYAEPAAFFPIQIAALHRGEVAAPADPNQEGRGDGGTSPAQMVALACLTLTLT